MDVPPPVSPLLHPRHHQGGSNTKPNTNTQHPPPITSHTTTVAGGSIGELDFRFGGIGAPVNGLKAFATTAQLALPDKIANAVALATSPVVKVGHCGRSVP